jgi:hypothetical protein
MASASAAACAAAVTQRPGTLLHLNRARRSDPELGGRQRDPRRDGRVRGAGRIPACHLGAYDRATNRQVGPLIRSAADLRTQRHPRNRR